MKKLGLLSAEALPFRLETFLYLLAQSGRNDYQCIHDPSNETVRVQNEVSLMGCFGRGILQLILVLLLIQLVPIYTIHAAGLVCTVRRGLGTGIFRRENHC